ncbi:MULTISPECIES: PPOX class F420-dependent oxidoreductase [Protofrankia]|nr:MULTISPECIES: PPOX class F420-dependent oxidoreductase [Protofrankia]
MSDVTSIPATHRDLLETPSAAAFTTVGAAGYPQTTAIWFLLDGDVVRTSLHRSRQKYRNVVDHPQATLFLIDPTNPFRTLEVRGDVTLEDTSDTSFLERLLVHYGQTLETFPAPTDNRVLLTLTPRRIVANG